MLRGRKSCISTFTAAFATATTSWNFQHGSTGWARADVVTSRYPWNVRTYRLYIYMYWVFVIAWLTIPVFFGGELCPELTWAAIFYDSVDGWTDGRNLTNLTSIQQKAIFYPTCTIIQIEAHIEQHGTCPSHYHLTLPTFHPSGIGTWFCVGRQHCGVLAPKFSEGHWIERLQPS